MATAYTCSAYPIDRKLMCKVEEIHTTLKKHLAKEEEQLLPLLVRHFSYDEQVGGQPPHV